MVDTIDLLFIKGRKKIFIEFACCFVVRTKWFLNDQALKTFAINNVFRFEVLGNSSEELRCHRQEEELVVISLVFFVKFSL